MLKIDRNLYNNISGINGNQQIEPGWYCCVILAVMESETAWGSPAVTFHFDVADGQFKGYYSADYKSNTDPNKKWRGSLEQSIDEKGLPYFKGMITAIEESNPGYQFDFDETKLKGKKVGIGFRKEWYEKNGEDKYVVRACAFRDIKKVLSGELEPPKDKPKKGATSAPAQGYTSPNLNPPGYQTPGPAVQAPNWEPLDPQSEELPF